MKIRISELSFDKNEIQLPANNLKSFNKSDNIVEILLKKTEGWIVGLRLAHMTLVRNKDIEKKLEEMKGNRPHIIQYLLNEVFLQQEEDIKK